MDFLNDSTVQKLQTLAKHHGSSVDQFVNHLISNYQHVDIPKERDFPAKSRLSLVINHLPIMVFAVDRHGDFVISEGQALELLGVKAGELVGLSSFDLFQDVPHWRGHFEKAIGGELVSFLIEARNLIFDVKYLPWRDENNDIIGIIGLAFDNTQFVKTKRELIKTQETATKAEIIGGIGHWTWDLSNDNLYWSDGIYALVGKEQQDNVTIQTLYDLLHPDDINKTNTAIEKALEETGEYELTHRLVRDDGQVVIVDEKAVVEYDDAGQPSRMIGTARDVTKQHEITESLRMKEEELRLQYESIPIPAFTWASQNGDFILTGSNSAAKSYAPNIRNIYGMKASDLYADNPEIVEVLWRCFTTQNVVERQSEYRFRSEPNVIKYVKATLVYSPPNRVIVYMQDVTQLKETEIALKKLNRELEDRINQRTDELQKINNTLRAERDFTRSLIEIAPVIILVLDDEGNIILHNQFLSDLLGISFDKVKGKNWIDNFVPELYRDEIRALFQTALMGTQTEGNTNPIVDRKGNVHQIVWYDKTLRDTEDKRLLIAVGVDITKQIQAENLLTRLTVRNKIAHNLHDSVSQTLWSANILANSLPKILRQDQDRAQEIASEISNIIETSLNEMRYILLELKPEIINEAGLKKLLEELCYEKLFHNQIAYSISMDNYPEYPNDINLAIYRITQEAINNIVKHSEATEISISTNIINNTVEYVVKDNGKGFALDLVSGTSLGLSIMNERAKEIGAELEIMSDIGKGVIIKVILQI